MTDKFSTWLWFDGNAEEAAGLTSVFPDSRIVRVDRAASDAPGNKEGDPHGRIRARRAHVRRPERGTAVPVQRGDQHPGPVRRPGRGRPLLGRPHRGWGEESMCGWLKDKYGLSWQIVPKVLNEAPRHGRRRRRATRHGSDAQDAEARRRDAAGRPRRDTGRVSTLIHPARGWPGPSAGFRCD